MRLLREAVLIAVCGIVAGFLIGFYVWALNTMQGANW